MKADEEKTIYLFFDFRLWVVAWRQGPPAGLLSIIFQQKGTEMRLFNMSNHDMTGHRVALHQRAV